LRKTKTEEECEMYGKNAVARFQEWIRDRKMSFMEYIDFLREPDALSYYLFFWIFFTIFFIISEAP
jgi:hypothetical protein